MTAGTPGPGGDDLQFDRAEAAGGQPAGPVCATCGTPITTEYFETGGQVVCESCKNQVEAANVSGVAAGSFVRAGFFGFLGAVAGAAVYYGVLAATGYEIGLIAILVGFMVGYAVRGGARGLGGRRYQVLALMLTYLAIGATYVPLVMREMAKDAATDAPADSTSLEPAPAGDSASVSPAAVSPALALAALVVLAALMPILVVVGGFPESLISALIIGFALHQAWRMTGRVKVIFTGPFKVAPAA